MTGINPKFLFKKLTAAGLSLSMDDLTDATVITPSVGEVLKWNGSEWINGTPATVSAGLGITFYNSSPTLIPTSSNNVLPLLSLNKQPVTTAEQTISGTASSNTVAFAAWRSEALGRAVINAGSWNITSYVGVDVPGGVTTLSRNVLEVLPFAGGTVTTTGAGTTRTATASAGTPFAVSKIDASAVVRDASYLQTPQGLYQISARTSDTVVTIIVPAAYTNEAAVAVSVWKKLFGITTNEINTVSPDYLQTDTDIAQGAFNVSLTSCLGGMTFVTSSATRTLTVTYDGTARNTKISSPLDVLHNDLGGLQGGGANDLYHLTAAERTIALDGLTPHANLTGMQGGAVGERYHLTSAEYTGTGAGNFVRRTAPTLDAVTIDGNQTFIGNGRRIAGLMAPATHANRLLYTASEANTVARLGIIPSGTATSSALNVYNSSDPDNAAIGLFVVTPTTVAIRATLLGSGATLPVTVDTGGLTRVTVETTGFVTFAIGITIPAPTAPTLLNSWVNAGGANMVAGYWKDAYGVVHLQGFVQSGTVASIIFTLPTGYRPTAKIFFYSNDGITVEANGDVTSAGPTGSHILDGFTFRST